MLRVNESRWEPIVRRVLIISGLRMRIVERRASSENFQLIRRVLGQVSSSIHVSWFSHTHLGSNTFTA